MGKFTEFEYPSKGAGTIHAYRWEPEGRPIAVFQIIHGIAEHAMRYDAFARWLNAHGYLVTAEDHMGHGKSQGSGAALYFECGWLAAVDDSYALLCRTREAYPDLPYFLLGHSMGSFLARTLLWRYPAAGLRAAVLCGTGWQNPVVLRAGRALCAAERKRVGPKQDSSLLTRLVFGAYNGKFKDARSPNDWICTDRAVVDAYTNDPMCGGNATVGLIGDMLGGIAMIQDKKNLDRMPKNLPVLFIAGYSDPVGNMSKGVKKTAEVFRAVGMKDVSVRFYDGRHEILNEPCREQVFQDVEEFCRKQL